MTGTIISAGQIKDLNFKRLKIIMSRRTKGESTTEYLITYGWVVLIVVVVVALLYAMGVFTLPIADPLMESICRQECSKLGYYYQTAYTYDSLDKTTCNCVYQYCNESGIYDYDYIVCKTDTEKIQLDIMNMTTRDSND